MSTTPNMLLTNPSPLITTGPTWADNISNSLNIIDAHDHSASSGVKISPAGININADLQFNSHAPTELRATIYEEQSADPSESAAVYFKDGDLYIKNVAGQVVQITTGTSVNAGSGSISGLVSPASASFSPITNTFVWLWDANLPARQVMSEISLYEYNNAAAAPVIIASATGTSTYTMTLPAAVAASPSLLKMDAVGDLSYSTSTTPYYIPRANSGGTDIEWSTVDTNSISNLAVTTGKIADNAVFLQKLYSRAFSTSTAAEGNVLRVNFSTTLSSTSSVQLVTGDLANRGRPVMICIQANENGAASYLATGGGVSTVNIEVKVNGSIVALYQWIVTTQDPITLSHITLSTAATNTYSINAYKSSGGAPDVVFNNCAMIVYEL